MSFQVVETSSEQKITLKREASCELNNEPKKARLDDTNSSTSLEANQKLIENGAVDEKNGNLKESSASSQQQVQKPPASRTFVKIKKSTSKKPSGRYKKCGECAGCQKADCGVCQNCRITKQYGDKLKLGGAECLMRTCTSPIPLTVDSITTKDGKGKMQAMMALQDDGTSPYREINGEVYDLRCYICKKLPRAGMANRSELYRHYSVYHFYKELNAEFAGTTSCTYANCTKGAIQGKGLADHLGQVHNQVDKYLPEENRIPLKIQRSSNGRQSKGSSRKKVNIEFPCIPDKYDINTNEVAFCKSGLDVDGVQICLQHEEEDLEADVPLPDLSDVGDNVESCWKCGICNDESIINISTLLKHLQTGHKMTLTSLPSEDMVKFLETEGFIKQVNDKELEDKEESEEQSEQQESVITSSLQSDIDLITNEINISEQVEDCKEGFEGFNSEELAKDVGKENIGPVLL